MKEEISIVILSIFLVLGICFIIVNIQQTSLIGLVIEDDLTGSENISFEEDLSNNQRNVTRDMALEAINESEEIKNLMIENNFSITQVDDILIEAKREFERAEYAEILRDSTLPENRKIEAKEVLKLLDWEKITYEGVLIHTNKVDELREESFMVFDSLYATKLRINENKELNIDLQEEQDLLDKAYIEFYDGRINDVNNMLKEINERLEAKVIETATLNSLRKGLKRFIFENALYIIIFLILLGAIVLFSYRKLKRKFLKKKITKLRLEQKILLELIKKSQLGRYKTRNLPPFIYNIKMDKYKKRINEIKGILPVIEGKLGNFRHKTSKKHEPIHK